MAAEGVRGLGETGRRLSFGFGALTGRAFSPRGRPGSCASSPYQQVTCPRPSFMTGRRRVATAMPTGSRVVLPNPIPGVFTPPPPNFILPTQVDFLPNVPVTIYDFPSLEPRRVECWSARHLHLPFRRDLLHLAVIHEADATRQGTTSVKTKWEVHGSHRKLYPQKGGGRSRVNWKQTPLRRGGGKSHGPRPRDFSTKINRKVYDLAWRTALSWRYRRGELIVTEDGMELPLPQEFLRLAERGALARELEDAWVATYVRGMMTELRWGRAHGRTTFITRDRRPNLATCFDVAAEQGRALTVDDVDVKDLLETGRIVMEIQVLKHLIEKHRSDLMSKAVIHGVRSKGPPLGRILVPTL